MSAMASGLIRLPLRAVPRARSAHWIALAGAMLVASTWIVFAGIARPPLWLLIAVATTEALGLLVLLAVVIQIGHAGREIVRTAGALAEGDVTVECGVTLSDHYGEIGTVMNAAVTRMREVLQVTDANVQTIQGSSDMFEESASFALESAEDTARAAQTVSEAGRVIVEQMTVVDAAMEQLVSSIREIAASASNATRIAVEASGVASEASDGISKLERSSQEIGSVVATIASIADRTGLLALNAAIEAARVGEAGKGFLVVSDEVRSLADKTRVAAGDVDHRVQSVVTGMQSARASVSEAQEIVEEIVEIQSMIAASVEEQASVVSELRRTVAEANGANESAAEDIGAVAEMARVAADGATRIHGAVGELAAGAGAIRSVTGDLLGSFTISDGTRARSWTGFVEIHRSELDRRAGPVKVPVTAETTIDAFLDFVYLAVKDYVRLYTYNRAWVLVDPGRGELSAMGTRWARARGRARDDRHLVDAGINPGTTLRAVRTRRAG